MLYLVFTPSFLKSITGSPRHLAVVREISGKDCSFLVSSLLLSCLHFELNFKKYRCLSYLVV